MRHFYFFATLLLLCCGHVFAQRIINVTSYGLHPDSFEDASPLIQNAIEAIGGEDSIILFFPKGRYDFWPQLASERNFFISNTSSEEECPSKRKKIGLLFEEKKHLKIDGNGSLLIFHGKMTTFAFDHCKDITMENISIDFERPTMSELTFQSVSDSLIIASVHPDSKYAIIDNRLIFYGEGWTMQHYHAIGVIPTEGLLYYSTFKPLQSADTKLLANGTIQFRGNFSKAHYVAGEVLTVRDPIRDHVGMFVNQCEQVFMHNVKIHYMHGLGIVNQFSKNLHYDSIWIEPSRGRQISCFADAMHFSGCSGSVLIENCRFKGAHDDPINVHGTHLQVSALLSSTKVKVRFMHPQTYGMEAFFNGDSISFVHATSLQVYASGKVKKARLVSEREMELEFEKVSPDSLRVGDCLENITCTPDLTIRNCNFAGTNTRGLLVTTRRKVLIENNTFYRTGMHAILIADDAQSWFESGPVKDVTIRNNTFIECGYNISVPYVINIAPENHASIKNYFVHSNIRVEHNTFKVFSPQVLAAKSVDGLTFLENTIEKTMTSFGNVTLASKPILIPQCKNLEIKNNEYRGIQAAVQTKP
ncbi:MAG: right-handed parallel beta-helix repeat-containing protein [Chitinophaga sp.]|uniref:right-handed parallel beta-helix repeat-containing protein n=1 Tax=Chitinophaga sp. TaxID=1869181 RepID=UPI0025BE235E|nr:right-handed parallel beta-helix repeat-containing protein [Chitinophaga sp.]MBV8253341.1 right-handed parallel beta-helix repeat-containing protein [Chitinophaga sp.]